MTDAARIVKNAVAWVRADGRTAQQLTWLRVL
jgi:hypothetical protein